MNCAALIYGGILTSICIWSIQASASIISTPFCSHSFRNISLYLFLCTVYFFSAILWCECDTVLNHTGLYEYRHGKMLMHLRFIFETLSDLSTPGEYMRYYRQLRGLTTRQLAEKLNIVPATVLGYEQGRFPIPYEISVVATQMLDRKSVV